MAYKYTFKIDFNERTIIVDDYNNKTQYYFHESKNPYEHDLYLMFDDHDFDECELLNPGEAGVVETTKNILGINEKYDIKDFDSFTKYLTSI